MQVLYLLSEIREVEKVLYGDDLSWLKNARYQLKTLIIDNGVEDCEGLRYQKNIEDLQFFYHHITDVSPIEGFKQKIVEYYPFLTESRGD